MHELWYRPMAEERLYSLTEAAAKLGVSPATIANWIRLGIATASRQDELGRQPLHGCRPRRDGTALPGATGTQTNALAVAVPPARTIRGRLRGESEEEHAGSAAEHCPRKGGDGRAHLADL